MKSFQLALLIVAIFFAMASNLAHGGQAAQDAGRGVSARGISNTLKDLGGLEKLKGLAKGLGRDSRGDFDGRSPNY